jgi:4a-hydroxytetrahydrobiopterin dehydratase
MIKTFAELFADHCRPLEGGQPMKTDAVRAQLVELPTWESDGKRLFRKLQFADYREAIAFVNALAWVIHREDHHPEMKVGYDTVELRFDTHSVGGISMNDFICAAKCDALYADRPKPKAPE